MHEVASLGSINVDRMRHVARTEIEAIAAGREWFPEPGETVRREECPEGLIDEPDETTLGGKGANQAAAAAQAGADTGLFGKVGSDAPEFQVLAQLEAADVDVDPISEAAVETGTAYVFIDDSGEDWIVVCAKANGEVDRAYVEDHAQALTGASVVLLQNEIPLEPMETFLAGLETDRDPPTVIFDPAPATGAEQLLTYDAVEYITPNEREYEAIADSLDTFEGTVVQTRGGDDLVVEGDHSFTVTPPAVEVEDSTGSGDVFNGFLAARLAAGDPFREAVEVATVAGALATRRTWAQEAIPTLAAVEEFRDAPSAE